MAWRMVLQPNGYLARFSDVVDDFTHYEMTEAEALEYCADYLGRHDAKVKVAAAFSNPNRFTDEIDWIREVHGDERADEWLSILSE